MVPEHEAIRVENLVKDFGSLRALDAVSFRVLEGEIFSLLGPNGAGKSTTISIIAGLLRATSGEASVFGRSIAREPQAVKAAIGVVPQEVALYPDLSAQENLLFWGRMYGLGGRRLLGAVQAARLALGLGEAAVSPAREQALERALADWNRPRVTLRTETFQPAGGFTGFLQSSPGMIVQFTIYGLITSAMILVLERKSRALQRLLTTSVSRASIIAGHLGAMFTLLWLQEAALVACGQLAFGVDYLRAPAATLVLMSALALWAACLGLLIAALARNEQQVIMYSLIAMFVFSALGGAWFPLDVAGGGFARIGRLTPAAWAMDGFRGILLRGQGLIAILRPAGLLAACGAAFFGLALWRFRFE